MHRIVLIAHGRRKSRKSANPVNPDPDDDGKELGTAMINDKLTYDIIGCAMTVHRALGPGFQEVIYQRALAMEMERAGVDFGREIEQPIYYRGIEIGSRRADFIVGNRVVVELKALTALEPVHLAQAKNYVIAYGLDLGLLLNFGAQSLEYRRIFGGNRR